MKQKIILLITLFCVAPIYAQTTFQKTYGGTSNEFGYAVLQIDDEGYLIIGSESSYGAGDENVYLIKTDPNGTTIWTKIFGGPGPEQGTAGLQTNDGGYIITGYTMPFYGSDYNVCLIKTDMNGNLLWSKTYGGPDDDYAFSVQETIDGGYITAGFTNSYGAGLYDIYLVKTDSIGNLLWTKTFGGTSNDEGYNVMQTIDGGYIIVGTTYNFVGALSSGVYLIKMNENGALLWSKVFAGASGTVCTGHDILQTTDGGYLIGGSTYECGNGGTDFLVIKTDTNGNATWMKTYGGVSNEYLCKLETTVDGSYIVSGMSNWDFPLIKIDATGSMIWSKTYGGSGGINEEFCWDAQQTSDSGYVIIGSTGNFGLGFNNIYIVKTDAYGNSGCNQTTYITTEAICTSSVINNPATLSFSGGSMSNYFTNIPSGVNTTILCDAVSINDYNLENKNISIFPTTLYNGESIYIKHEIENPLSYTIIDINGKIVEYKSLSNNSIQINGLSAGMYIIQFSIENNVFDKEKFIVLE